MKFKVVLYESDEGFAIGCPSLPGCWSQGETREEALENIRDAIREMLESIWDELKENIAKDREDDPQLKVTVSEVYVDPGEVEIVTEAEAEAKV